MTGIEPLAYFAVRLLTCTSWISSGLEALLRFEHTSMVMARKGIPRSGLVLPFVLVMEFAGSALVLADLYVWAVSLVWIAFLILATYYYHRRWFTPEREFDQFQYVQFWKNVSMIGGLVALILLDPSRPEWLLRG